MHGVAPVQNELFCRCLSNPQANLFYLVLSKPVSCKYYQVNYILMFHTSKSFTAGPHEQPCADHAVRRSFICARDGPAPFSLPLKLALMRPPQLTPSVCPKSERFLLQETATARGKEGSCYAKTIFSPLHEAAFADTEFSLLD